MDMTLWFSLCERRSLVNIISEVTRISTNRLNEIINTGECSIKEEIILRVSC